MESTRKKNFPREIDVKLECWLPFGLVSPRRSFRLGCTCQRLTCLCRLSSQDHWNARAPPPRQGGSPKEGMWGGVVIFSLGVLRQCWFTIWNIYMFIISYFLNEIPSLIRFPSRSMISFKHSPLDDDTDSLIVVCWFSLMNSWNASC